jgi:hypothetical protein
MICLSKPSAGQPFLGSPVHDFLALACLYVLAFMQFLHMASSQQDNEWANITVTSPCRSAVYHDEVDPFGMKTFSNLFLAGSTLLSRLYHV